MNRRGRRLAFTVAATGLAVLLVLAIAHWNTVRDHVEAWYFQLTRETETLMPDPVNNLEVMRDFVRSDTWTAQSTFSEEAFPALLADCTGISVIVHDRSEAPLAWGRREITTGTVLQALKDFGYRVLEQRFPRRAYVVIRDPSATR